LEPITFFDCKWLAGSETCSVILPDHAWCLATQERLQRSDAGRESGFEAAAIGRSIATARCIQLVVVFVTPFAAKLAPVMATSIVIIKELEGEERGTKSNTRVPIAIRIVVVITSAAVAMPS
jgi:hypothetical protein